MEDCPGIGRRQELAQTSWRLVHGCDHVFLAPWLDDTRRRGPAEVGTLVAGIERDRAVVGACHGELAARTPGAGLAMGVRDGPRG